MFVRCARTIIFWLNLVIIIDKTLFPLAFVVATYINLWVLLVFVINWLLDASDISSEFMRNHAAEAAICEPMQPLSVAPCMDRATRGTGATSTALPRATD